MGRSTGGGREDYKNLQILFLKLQVEQTANETKMRIIRS